MLLRSLRPFTRHASVRHVVVVVPQQEADAPPEWLADLAGTNLTVTAGGPDRTDSARRGLAALHPSCSVVLVHDGARPLVGQPTIDTVISLARQGICAVPAVPVGDTLKETAADGSVLRVVRTIPRARLWRAQTPQAFPRPLLERAYAFAMSRESAGTDDAELVEALGAEVRIVPDSMRNMKVTTAEDLEFIEGLLARETAD